MTQHTPGPWIIQAKSAVYGPLEDRGGPYRKLIRQAIQTQREADEYGGSIEEQEANARLIAAAPDLLAACQEFVRKVDAGEARSVASYQQMKAAIAKALEETL